MWCHPMIALLLMIINCNLEKLLYVLVVLVATAVVVQVPVRELVLLNANDTAMIPGLVLRGVRGLDISLALCGVRFDWKPDWTQVTFNRSLQLRIDAIDTERLRIIWNKEHQEIKSRWA